MDTYHDFVAGEVLKSAYVSMARLGAESSDQYATSAAVVLRDYIQTMMSYMSRDYGDFKFSCLVQERAWAALQIVASATRTGDERACRRSECLWRGRERGGKGLVIALGEPCGRVGHRKLIRLWMPMLTRQVRAHVRLPWG